MSFPLEIASLFSAFATEGTNLFIGSRSILPDGDEGFLWIYETGGTGALRVHNGQPVERPSAQIGAAAFSYVEARALLTLAWNAIGGADGLHNTIVDGVFYLSLVPRQSFVDIGLDDKGRARLAFNIDAEKEES